MLNIYYKYTYVQSMSTVSFTIFFVGTWSGLDHSNGEGTNTNKISNNFKYFCEAQGKGRARGGPRKVTQRSFMDGGWWMVDILSLMLYIKFGCHHHHPPTFPQVS